MIARGDRVLRRHAPDVLGLVLRTWSRDGRHYARVYWDTRREATTDVGRLVKAGEGMAWPYDPNEQPF